MIILMDKKNYRFLTTLIYTFTLTTLIYTFTGKYNHQRAGISYQTTRHVARCPVCTQRVSLALAHALAKIRNFEHVASKTQCEHATVFSHLHASVYSKNAGVQRVKMPVKTRLLGKNTIRYHIIVKMMAQFSRKKCRLLWLIYFWCCLSDLVAFSGVSLRWRRIVF